MQCIYGEMAGTLELIQALPAELREKICTEYIIIRLWQRKMQGWDKVHQDLQKTPFCKRQQRLTIVTPWYKNEDGDFELLCVSCLRELLTAMKTMIPQDLKNTLIQPEEQQEEVDLTDMEEYDLKGSGEPVYETPIMTPQLYRRIMANEFSQDQVEYIIKKSLHL